MNKVEREGESEVERKANLACQATCFPVQFVIPLKTEARLINYAGRVGKWEPGCEIAGSPGSRLPWKITCPFAQRLRFFNFTTFLAGKHLAGKHVAYAKQFTCKVSVKAYSIHVL